MKPGVRPAPSPDREVLAGLVERVTFHNPENGFCVLRTKARGHRDLVTVVGHAAMVGAGEWITASGEWVNDRTHGHQFKARFVRTSTPSSVEGIEKYLGSGMIRGIGPVYAGKLVRAFGEKVFDVIEAEPGRLREVTGIGPMRAGRITDAWAEQKVVREIMVFLHSHGVGTARAVRIFKTYGADAVEVMTENPYRLARDIRGIGFKTADAIAMKLGIEKTATVRVRAGISYALTEAMDEGHCGLPADELGPLASRLLEVSDDLIRTALDLELAEGTVVADTVEDTPCIFLGGLYRAEQAIAARLSSIAAGRLPWPHIDAEKALPWVERKTGLTLAAGQAEAVRLALTSKVTVVTGGPGVGKTTIVNAILRILSAKGVQLLLCAPTGRAAKRMSEATALEAKTVHRLLEVDPRHGGFRRDADNPLDCGLLVIDETSMVDVMLMRSLLAAVPDEAALLIVGDVDQLPSVGPRSTAACSVAARIVASASSPASSSSQSRPVSSSGMGACSRQPLKVPAAAREHRGRNMLRPVQGSRGQEAARHLRELCLFAFPGLPVPQAVGGGRSAFIAVRSSERLERQHQVGVQLRLVPRPDGGFPEAQRGLELRIVDLGVESVEPVDHLTHQIAHRVVVEMGHARPRYLLPVGVDDRHVRVVPGAGDRDDTGVDVLELRVADARQGHQLGHDRQGLSLTFVHGPRLPRPDRSQGEVIGKARMPRRGGGGSSQRKRAWRSAGLASGGDPCAVPGLSGTRDSRCLSPYPAR